MPLGGQVSAAQCCPLIPPWAATNAGGRGAGRVGPQAGHGGEAHEGQVSQPGVAAAAACLPTPLLLRRTIRPCRGSIHLWELD